MGCVLASSAGGLKSISVSLLELSPGSLSSALTSTWSDRGGAGFGALLDWEAEDEDASGVGEFWVGGFGVDEFAGAEPSGFDVLCAHALKQPPRSTSRNQTRISLF
ncbi:hypothetical protein SBA1_60014 [Candidatus Sulfotelmatobacter kueseliae]|uniref:Uncharacterized protein n=1 Tax=Candidatus Sulfotelmatobacter kueseliae TaxID=2042962 RepID=A0A2U3L0U1_9BACT|nr:hypothetical protein SBA1_60014 [Candidatus Sulfotelmatobacter kueseliae]